MYHALFASKGMCEWVQKGKSIETNGRALSSDEILMEEISLLNVRFLLSLSLLPLTLKCYVLVLGFCYAS